MVKRAIMFGTVVLFAIAVIIICMHYIAGFPTKIDDPAAQYVIALQAISDNYRLAVEENTTYSTANITFTEKSRTTICSLEQSIQVDQIFTSGNYSTLIQQIYTDGTIYLRINEHNFCGRVSSQDISRRYIPAAMFDHRLYNTITGTKKNNIITVNFSNPTGAEDWALPVNALLTDAFGTAQIDNAGHLTGSSYEIRYLLYGVAVHKRYTVTYQDILPEVISVPNTQDSYTPVNDIDGPILLERLCGFLVQAKGLSSTIRESVFCGAFGDQRDTIYELNGYGTAEAKITTYNTGQPDSAARTITETEEDELYRYYNLLLSGIPALEHIQNIYLTEESGHITITYGASDSYAKHLTQYICDSLYGAPDMLTSRASQYTVITMDCTIEIDLETLLPHAIQTTYSGSYTIDGIEYSVTYTQNQTFQVKKQEPSSCFFI